MTKYLPPKISKYNHLPTKKPRSGNINPEVHIALNFAATLSTGLSASAVPGQTIVPTLTLEPTLPIGGSNSLVHMVNIGVMTVDMYFFSFTPSLLLPYHLLYTLCSPYVTLLFLLSSVPDNYTLLGLKAVM